MNPDAAILATAGHGMRRSVTRAGRIVSGEAPASS